MNTFIAVTSCATAVGVWYIIWSVNRVVDAAMKKDEQCERRS